MRLLLLLPILLVAAVAQAQESRQVTCRFMAFGARGAAKEVTAVSKDGTEITCPLPNGRLSKKIVCNATNNKITFLGSKDAKPAATAVIPSGANDAILIFVNSGKADVDEWRVFVIEDNAKKFPDGGAFVANFSNSNTRFIIGEHKGMLKAGGSNGYEMPKNRDTFNMAPVVFEMLQGKEWTKASESGLRFLPGMRYLIISYLDPASGRPRISTVKDIAPPQAAKKR